MLRRFTYSMGVCLIGVLLGPLSVTPSVALCTHPTSTTWTCSSQVDLDALFNSNNPGVIQNGDTINVAAGTYQFNTKLTINNGKNWSLIGAGQSLTTFQAGTGVTNLGSGYVDITVANGTGTTRISGITWDCNGITQGNGGQLIIRGTTNNLRLDNMTFLMTCPNPSAGFWILGDIRGVADHNTCRWPSSATSAGICYYLFHPGWNGASDIYGDASWATAESLGTSSAMFFENNAFDYSNATAADPFRFCSDGWRGKREVFRFNTITNCYWDMHGLESTGRSRSARQLEAYNNNYTFNQLQNYYAMFDVRGGLTIGFDNAATMLNGATIGHSFGFKQENAELQPYAPFGFCGRLTDFYSTSFGGISASGGVATVTINTTGSGTWAQGFAANASWTVSGASPAAFNGTFPMAVVDGTHMTYTCAACPNGAATGTIIITSPWNQNVDQYGHLCMDQVGAGVGDNLGGGDNPIPIGWPHQAVTPNYDWHNTVSGVTLPADGVQEPNRIQANRDFYTDDATNCAPSGASCSAGIGRGTRSQRPVSCTIGTAWWSTDGGTDWNTTNGPGVDGGLDKCTGTNTWTNNWYVPYTYPHPLVTGGVADLFPPAAPNSVKVY